MTDNDPLASNVECKTSALLVKHKAEFYKLRPSPLTSIIGFLGLLLYLGVIPELMKYDPSTPLFYGIILVYLVLVFQNVQTNKRLDALAKFLALEKESVR